MSVEIVLDKPSASFIPGETITGVVRVTVDDERHCKYLTVNLEGAGRVKIFDREYDLKKSELTQTFLVHKVEEVYLSDSVAVSGGNETIPAGESDFPFQYTLPDSVLPCTFETNQNRALGGISYWLVATLQTGGIDERTCKLPFTVLGFLDLNQTELDLDPFKKFQQTETFRFCCLCCRSKPVTIILTIPKRALVSGESILFRVDSDNPSRRKLKKPKMELVSHVTCLAHGKLRTEEKVLQEVEGPVVLKKSKAAWNEKDFKVPLVEAMGIPPSDLGGGCSIMHVSYFLRFTMARPKCNGHIEICTQILVGTVPLRDKVREVPLTAVAVKEDKPEPAPSRSTYFWSS